MKSYWSSAILLGLKTPRMALDVHAHVAQSHTNMCICFRATQETDWEEIKLLEQDGKTDIDGHRESNCGWRPATDEYMVLFRKHKTQS